MLLDLAATVRKGFRIASHNLATVHEDRIHRVIGHLPEAIMSRIDECLKAALGLR